MKIEVATHPNEPYGFCGRKALLNHAHALVTVCPWCVNPTSEDTKLHIIIIIILSTIQETANWVRVASLYIFMQDHFDGDGVAISGVATSVHIINTFPSSLQQHPGISVPVSSSSGGDSLAAINVFNELTGTFIFEL